MARLLTARLQKPSASTGSRTPAGDTIPAARPQGGVRAPAPPINRAGVNSARQRELDATAVARADRIVVDSLEQSQQEAGDLIAAFGDQADRWPPRRGGLAR